jgi:DNA-binding HxlR family transcriptional regulator
LQVSTYLEVWVTVAKTIRGRVLQSQDAIELVSDKWRIPILHVLAAGPQRAGELQRAVHEVSSKVLTQTLRRMERDGLISRKVASVIPPRVEYSLTPLGRSVIVPLRELCLWAKAHVPERDRARRKFDSQTGT